MDIVSACLVGEKCRYDATECINKDLKHLYEQGRLFAVCPECAAGLDTPRNPMEIIGGDGSDVLDGTARVCSKDGADFTEVFIAGANMVLGAAKTHKAKHAYLKSNSPSCGCGSIYDGSFSGIKRQGDGVTAALLKKNGIIVVEV